MNDPADKFGLAELVVWKEMKKKQKEKQSGDLFIYKIKITIYYFLIATANWTESWNDYI